MALWGAEPITQHRVPTPDTFARDDINRNVHTHFMAARSWNQVKCTLMSLRLVNPVLMSLTHVNRVLTQQSPFSHGPSWPLLPPAARCDGGQRPSCC